MATIGWETEIDTPATVAVIGGGAIGIEAALYARFLGYYVLLIDAAKMAQSWRSGGTRKMRTSFREATSPLGLAALEAHRPDSLLPDQASELTGLEFAQKYLVPLARTDLLLDSVQVHSRVMSVSRIELRRDSPGDIQDRADTEFRLAIHSKSRGWYTERADIVLDCSGVSRPRWLGPGGGMAMGEIEHAGQIEYHSPDVCGKQRATYAGYRILLSGTSHAAFENLLALMELMRSEPATRVTWLLPLEPGLTEPLQWLERLRASGDVGQRLGQREELRAALTGTFPGIVPLPALGLERIIAKPTGLAICAQVNEDITLDMECDCIISNIGLQPEWDHAEALRIGRSAVLDRSGIQLTAADNTGVSGPLNTLDMLDNSSPDLYDSIYTMEPHYYVLGSKSFGLANDRFTLAHGHQQIRQAFALIGGREDLDLYSNIQRS